MTSRPSSFCNVLLVATFLCSCRSSEDVGQTPPGTTVVFQPRALDLLMQRRDIVLARLESCSGAGASAKLTLVARISGAEQVGDHIRVGGVTCSEPFSPEPPVPDDAQHPVSDLGLFALNLTNPQQPAVSGRPYRVHETAERGVVLHLREVAAYSQLDDPEARVPQLRSWIRSDDPARIWTALSLCRREFRPGGNPAPEGVAILDDIVRVLRSSPDDRLRMAAFDAYAWHTRLERGAPSLALAVSQLVELADSSNPEVSLAALSHLIALRQRWSPTEGGYALDGTSPYRALNEGCRPATRCTLEWLKANRAQVASNWRAWYERTKSTLDGTPSDGP